MAHPLVLEPLRDDRNDRPEGYDYGVRVVDDLTGAEIDLFGWHDTLAEALEEACAAYPSATVLDPTWTTVCDHDSCQAPLTIAEIDPDGLGRVICDKCRALEAREEARGAA